MAIKLFENIDKWLKQQSAKALEKSKEPIPFRDSPILERLGTKIPGIFKPITRQAQDPTLLGAIGQFPATAFNIINAINEFGGGFLKGVRQEAREFPARPPTRGLYKAPVPKHPLKAIERGVRGGVEEIGSGEFAILRETQAFGKEAGLPPGFTLPIGILGELAGPEDITKGAKAVKGLGLADELVPLAERVGRLTASGDKVGDFIKTLSKKETKDIAEKFGGKPEQFFNFAKKTEQARAAAAKMLPQVEVAKAPKVVKGAEKAAGKVPEAPKLPRISPPRTPAQKELASKLANMTPGEFSEWRATLDKEIATLKQAGKEIPQEMIEEWNAQARELRRRIPGITGSMAAEMLPTGKFVPTAREMGEIVTSLGSRTAIPVGEEALPSQIATIRELRRRLDRAAVFKDKHLLPLLEKVTGTETLAPTKMTQEEANKIIDFLQPRNYENIESELGKIKESILYEKTQKLGEPSLKAAEEVADVEDAVRGVEDINKTLSETIELARMADPIPVAKEVRPLRKALGFFAHFMPQQVQARLLGIREIWHAPLRRIITTAKLHEMRLRKSLLTLFEDLTPEELSQAIDIQLGFKIDNPLPKAQKAADYMQSLFDAHLEFINRVRAAAGKKPLAPLKGRYLPYILEEMLQDAIELGGGWKMGETRLKRLEDIGPGLFGEGDKVGLFTKEPERIAEMFARSSGSHLKKNLYTAFLREGAEELKRAKGVVADFITDVEQWDIYGFLTPMEKKFRTLGADLNTFVGRLASHKVPISDESLEVLRNTTLFRDLAENAKDGYLILPKFQAPNIPTFLRDYFYIAKLGFNAGFGLVNLTQPAAGVPWIGFKNYIKALGKTAYVMLPWNKALREDYYRVLSSAAADFDRYLAGELITTRHLGFLKESTTARFIEDSFRWIGDITEKINRIESAIGAEMFLEEGIAKGEIKPLSLASKEKIMSQFSAYINYLSGPGYSPVAARGTFGKLAYIFLQYPTNTIGLYGDMARASIREAGVREVWQLLASEGGASKAAVEAFDKLSPAGRAHLFRVAFAIAAPVAMMYAATRSWNVAQRAVVGMNRIALWDTLVAFGEWAQDPGDREAFDVMMQEFRKAFLPTSIQRLADAIDIHQDGIIQSTISRTPIFVDKEEAIKALLFGRGATAQYEEAYPTWLAQLFGGEKTAPRLRELRQEHLVKTREYKDTAVKILREMNRVDTPAEKRAIIKKYFDSGELTEEVAESLVSLIEDFGKELSVLGRQFTGLTSADKALAIFEEMDRAKTKEEKRQILLRYAKEGILTDSVAKELVRLLTTQ